MHCDFELSRKYNTNLRCQDDIDYNNPSTSHSTFVFKNYLLFSPQTDGSNQRRTPGSHSRTPVTPCSPDTLDEEINNLSSMDEEDDDEDCRRKSTIPWNEHENPDVTRRTRYNILFLI